MYDQYYGLQGRPFQLTPDPHYYFESATHRKALSYLGYGLAQGEGFIVITGDIGAGKTTLVGHLMQTIDPARLTAVKIVSTQVEGDDMLRLAAQSFGLATDGLTKAATLQQIEGFLHTQARAGRRTLLIVDEAQNLPVSAIEELRMLSNFQLGGQSLLQIFLLGQPEFRDLVKSPQLEQLRQRVIATHHLEPMMEKEVEPYILHRLAVAGWAGNPRFTSAAFAALYTATGGVPRRLNALVSRVLLLGAIDQLEEIDADVVQAVVTDMGLDVDFVHEPVAPSVLDSVDTPQEVVMTEAEKIETPEAESIAFEPWDDEVEDELSVASAAPLTQPASGPFAAPQSSAPQSSAAPDDSDAVHDVDGPMPIESEYTAFTLGDAPDDYWESDYHEENAVMYDHAEPVEEPIVAQDVNAMPSGPTDTAQIDDLRQDMSAQIEALRAEISSLRAVTAHFPFAPAQPEQTVDPEVLKSCFTLIEERLSSLEFRAEEQDTALRRVLTLLVDWVEREEQMAAPRDSAAA